MLGLRGTLHESGALDESSVAEEAHNGGLRGREMGGAGASLGWWAGGIATDSVGRCSRRSRGRGGRSRERESEATEPVSASGVRC